MPTRVAVSTGTCGDPGLGTGQAEKPREFPYKVTPPTREHKSWGYGWARVRPGSARPGKAAAFISICLGQD